MSAKKSETLLEKALAVSPLPRNAKGRSTEEMLELALGYFSGRISSSQCAVVLGYGSSAGSGAAAVMATSLRRMVMSGRVKLEKVPEE